MGGQNNQNAFRTLGVNHLFVTGTGDDPKNIYGPNNLLFA
jgi:hypothetical protein